MSKSRFGRMAANPAEDALTNVRDAIGAWIEEARALGWPVPKPSQRHVAA
jgi:predicted RNase H-like HicB family nuclease